MLRHGYSSQFSEFCAERFLVSRNDVRELSLVSNRGPVLFEFEIRVAFPRLDNRGPYLRPTRTAANTYRVVSNRVVKDEATDPQICVASWFRKSEVASAETQGPVVNRRTENLLERRNS